MTDPAKADLCWDAFRYIANEMSAGELRHFEQRLGVDQQAREAVAVAVAVAQGVVSAPVHVVDVRRPRRARWPVHLTWSVAAGLAICAAFFGGWRFGDSGGNYAAIPSQPDTPTESGSGPMHDPNRATTLVSLWSRAGMAEVDASEADPGDLLAVASVEPGSDSLPDTALDVPDWMWAALRADLPGHAEPRDEWEDN